MIPYGRHSVSTDDIETVVDVLQHQFLTQGQQVPAFEQALVQYTGGEYCIAVNSGTSALHIACLALGIGAGDLVWTVPNSFAASANCALYCGASIDFVDIDPITRNLCPKALEVKLNHCKAQGLDLPKAIVVVHFSGLACAMEHIAELARTYDIALIEDAAHGLGGRYPCGNKIGAGTYADFTTLSFHPVKSITTAEGGALMTNNQELAKRARLFASHGITKDPSELQNVNPQEPWVYQQQALGFNYRLSDIHAALGINQLKRLDQFITARLRIAQRYQAALSALPITLPILDTNSAWHLYVIELQSHDRAQVFNALRAAGVGVNVHYIPIHWHPYYSELGFEKGQFPNSETYYRHAISLPIFPALTHQEQDHVIDVLYKELA